MEFTCNHRLLAGVLVRRLERRTGHGAGHDLLLLLVAQHNGHLLGWLNERRLLVRLDRELLLLERHGTLRLAQNAHVRWHWTRRSSSCGRLLPMQVGRDGFRVVHGRRRGIGQTHRWLRCLLGRHLLMHLRLGLLFADRDWRLDLVRWRSAGHDVL